MAVKVSNSHSILSPTSSNYSPIASPRVENSHSLGDYHLGCRCRLTRRRDSRTNLPSRVLPSTVAHRESALGTFTYCDSVLKTYIAPCELVQTISTSDVLPRHLSSQMTHSNTDNTLSLNADTSVTPNYVNRTPLATPRCPNSQELDYRGTIVPKTVKSRRLQTAPTPFPCFVGPRTGNSKYHLPSPTCPPPTPDLISEALGHAQPLTRRALRYIRRNARRAANYKFTSFTAGRLKTILSTVAGSIISTHDFPAQTQVTRRESEYDHNRRPSDPVTNPHTSRKFPALPSPS